MSEYFELYINYMLNGSGGYSRKITMRDPEGLIVNEAHQTLHYIDDQLPSDALDMIQELILGDATLKIHVYAEEFVPKATRIVPYNYGD